ncbi:uncharacterized protein PG998_010568 [Apiospora kogelbergensis]|uniref:uncharacterized protein n=1 Tax=Apiospora kogelbergensis TaxID=1337665 RepID=UPI00312D13FF
MAPQFWPRSEHSDGRRYTYQHDQLFLPPLFLALMLLTESGQPEASQSILSRVENVDSQEYKLTLGTFDPRFFDQSARQETHISSMLRSFTNAAAASVVQYLFDHADAHGNMVYRNLVDWDNVFIHASGASQLGVVKFLLSRQSEFCPSAVRAAHGYINWAGPNGLTALHAAASSRKGDPVGVCQFLLQNGAILENDDPRYPSPFHLACTNGFLDTVKFLHLSGAHVNRRCRNFNKCCLNFDYPGETFNQYDKIFSKRACTPLESTLEWLIEPYSWGERRDICRYLVDNGSETPSDHSLVNGAMKLFDVDLLSAALKPTTRAFRHRFLIRIFANGFAEIERDLASENRLKVVKIRMAHLLLDAGAQPRSGDAAEAAFLGDWYLVSRILAAAPDKMSQDEKVTLLEAAILSERSDVATKAFEFYPNLYSTNALCAATLVATRNDGDFGFVQALLNNRLGCVISDKEDSYREMTSIGIAAFGGNWELLQLLRRQLPWFQQAIVPIYYAPGTPKNGPPFDPLRLPCHYLHGFWRGGPFHDELLGQLGSIQMLSAQAEERIFNLFVNKYVSLSAECAIAIILWDSNSYDRLWSLVQKGYRIQKDFDPSRRHSPLHYAIETGNISIVRACLELGVDIDGYSHVEQVREEANSPLSFAINSGLLDIAGLLIDKGANVNNLETKNSGQTPLCAACRGGYLGIVRMLLGAGADPNKPNTSRHRLVDLEDSPTPLEAAAKHGRLDITHLLLNNGVNTEGAGRLQYVRAILLASKECHLQVRKLLESHRPWTKADAKLRNDLRLRDLRKYCDENLFNGARGGVGRVSTWS